MNMSGKKLVPVFMLIVILHCCATAMVAQSALANNNGVSGQSLVFTNVNGYTPVVNGFPVIVGESYQPNLTGTSAGQSLYAAASNPWTFGIYNIWCTLGSSFASPANSVSLSISYTDAVSGHLFSQSLGTFVLSTTIPTLVAPIHIAASNATTITTTVVLVMGTATFTKDCYISAANHH